MRRSPGDVVPLERTRDRVFGEPGALWESRGWVVAEVVDGRRAGVGRGAVAVVLGGGGRRGVGGFVVVVQRWVRGVLWGFRAVVRGESAERADGGVLGEWRRCAVSRVGAVVQR